jgi:hypothetical protein
MRMPSRAVHSQRPALSAGSTTSPVSLLGRHAEVECRRTDGSAAAILERRRSRLWRREQRRLATSCMDYPFADSGALLKRSDAATAVIDADGGTIAARGGCRLERAPSPHSRSNVMAPGRPDAPDLGRLDRTSRGDCSLTLQWKYASLEVRRLGARAESTEVSWVRARSASRAAPGEGEECLMKKA